MIKINVAYEKNCKKGNTLIFSLKFWKILGAFRVQIAPWNTEFWSESTKMLIFVKIITLSHKMQVQVTCQKIYIENEGKLCSILSKVQVI